MSDFWRCLAYIYLLICLVNRKRHLFTQETWLVWIVFLVAHSTTALSNFSFDSTMSLDKPRSDWYTHSSRMQKALRASRNVHPSAKGGGVTICTVILVAHRTSVYVLGSDVSAWHVRVGIVGLDGLGQEIRTQHCPPGQIVLENMHNAWSRHHLCLLYSFLYSCTLQNTCGSFVYEQSPMHPRW